MKKSLIALALVGAFASAQAAESNYTIYGRLDLGLTKTNQDGDAGALKLSKGTQSRLGFKGVEDLGSGLKGKFQIEHRFSADTGSQYIYNNGVDSEGTANPDKADPFWRGQAWVGLAGEFGEVRLGRQYQTLADVSDMIDPWGGDFVDTGVSEGLGAFAPASRNNNAITYMTPDMNGFSAKIQYALSEKDSVDSTFGLAGMYQNGPMAFGLAYQKSGDTGAVEDGLSASPDAEMTLLYGGYTFNNATTVGLGISIGTQDIRSDADGSSIFGLPAADDNYTDGLRSVKANAYTLSLTHKVGNGKILAGYQWANIKTDDVVAGSPAASFDDMKYKKFALGYHHSLSDRTTLYVNVASEKVDEDADNVSAYGFGVKHNF